MQRVVVEKRPCLQISKVSEGYCLSMSAYIGLCQFLSVYVSFYSIMSVSIRLCPFMSVFFSKYDSRSLRWYCIAGYWSTAGPTTASSSS